VKALELARIRAGHLQVSAEHGRREDEKRKDTKHGVYGVCTGKREMGYTASGLYYVMSTVT